MNSKTTGGSALKFSGKIYIFRNKTVKGRSFNLINLVICTLSIHKWSPIRSLRFGCNLTNTSNMQSWAFPSLAHFEKITLICKVLVSFPLQMKCTVSLHHGAILGLKTTTSPSKSSTFSSPDSSTPFLNRLSWSMSWSCQRSGEDDIMYFNQTSGVLGE